MVVLPLKDGRLNARFEMLFITLSQLMLRAFSLFGWKIIPSILMVSDACCFDISLVLIARV